MAKKRKAARKVPRGTKTAKKKAARKSVRRTAPKRKKPARKAAKRKAKPQGIGARIAGAVEAVLGTLTEAEQLHTKTVRKAGFQELE